MHDTCTVQFLWMSSRIRLPHSYLGSDTSPGGGGVYSVSAKSDDVQQRKYGRNWGYPQTQTALSESYHSPCARNPAYEHADPDAFKKDIAAGKTDAKPEIWKEWDKFTAAANAMGLEAAELAKVAQNGNMEAISAQVKKLSDTCGNCHKPYRKPKEESYKNKS